MRGWSSPGAHEANDELLQKLKISTEKFRKLDKLIEHTAKSLPCNKVPYLQRFLGYQTKHMLLLTKWAICCVIMTRDTTPRTQIDQLYKDACVYMDTLINTRKVLENDSWTNWHCGDKKINLPALRNATEEAYFRIITNELKEEN